jgi:metal-sulfur cluster biosynthetic enzyme
MPTEVEIRAALAEVIHPSFGMSLIALNMVRAVRVSNDAIEVDLVMRAACPGCPAGEVVLMSAHQALQALNPRAVRLTILPQVWVPPLE